MAPLVRDLDLPLAPVLARMERQGLGVDREGLDRLESRLGERIREVQTQVQQAAGEPLNLQSPKQVGRLLFEVLGLPPLKKTKTTAEQ